MHSTYIYYFENSNNATVLESSNFDVLGNWFSISAFGHNHWIFDEENNDPIVLRFGIMMVCIQTTIIETF